MTSEEITYHLRPQNLVLTTESLTQINNKYLGDFLAKRKNMPIVSFIANTQQRVGIKFQCLKLTRMIFATRARYHLVNHKSVLRALSHI